MHLVFINEYPLPFSKGWHYQVQTGATRYYKDIVVITHAFVCLHLNMDCIEQSLSSICVPVIFALQNFCGATGLGLGIRQTSVYMSSFCNQDKCAFVVVITVTQKHF